jgi:hypothetical protein
LAWNQVKYPWYIFLLFLPASLKAEAGIGITFSVRTSVLARQYLLSVICNSNSFQSILLSLPSLWWGDILILSCPSVRLSVTQFLSATPLKLLNIISWKLVGIKDTICSCAYYQDILIAWNLWELCPFELKISQNILLKLLFSTTPLILLNRISWNLVGRKDTICSCAYYQDIFVL